MPTPESQTSSVSMVNSELGASSSSEAGLEAEAQAHLPAVSSEQINRQMNQHGQIRESLKHSLNSDILGDLKSLQDLSNTQETALGMANTGAGAESGADSSSDFNMMPAV